MGTLQSDTTKPDPEASAASATMLRLASGDADAMRVLYDANCGLVYGLALRMLRDTGAAEDVTQEVFIQVWRRADRFDHTRGSVRAWLWAITRSRALDHLRLRTGRRAATEQQEPAVIRRVWPEEAMDLRDALGALSEPQRRAVELSYYKGMSHAEISRAIGEPLGTVKTRIRYGLHHMRMSLAR